MSNEKKKREKDEGIAVVLPIAHKDPHLCRDFEGESRPPEQGVFQTVAQNLMPIDTARYSEWIPYDFKSLM